MRENCIDYETKGIWYTYKSLHFEYELLLMLQDTRLNSPGSLTFVFYRWSRALRTHFGGVAPKRHLASHLLFNAT